MEDLTNLLEDIRNYDRKYLEEHPEIQAIINILIEDLFLKSDTNHITELCSKYFKSNTKSDLIENISKELELIELHKMSGDENGECISNFTIE